MLLDRAVRQDRDARAPATAGAARAARCAPCATSAGAARRRPRRGGSPAASSWLVSCSRSSSAWCADGEEVGDGPRAAAAGSAPLVGEVVDEEAVAEVGRDPAGRRVRLRRGSPRARARSSRCGRSRSTRRGRATRAIVCEPTGCAVSTYSSTIARRIAALRSSSSSAVRSWHSSSGTQATECQRAAAAADRSGDEQARGDLVGEQPARAGSARPGRRAGSSEPDAAAARRRTHRRAAGVGDRGDPPRVRSASVERLARPARRASSASSPASGDRRRPRPRST